MSDEESRKKVLTSDEWREKIEADLKNYLEYRKEVANKEFSKAEEITEEQIREDFLNSIAFQDEDREECEKAGKKFIPYLVVHVKSFLEEGYSVDDVVYVTRENLEECVKIEMDKAARLKAIPSAERERLIQVHLLKCKEEYMEDLSDTIYSEPIRTRKMIVEEQEAAKKIRGKLGIYEQDVFYNYAHKETLKDHYYPGDLNFYPFVIGFSAAIAAGLGIAAGIYEQQPILEAAGTVAKYTLGGAALGVIGDLAVVAPLHLLGIGINNVVYAIRNKIMRSKNIKNCKHYIEALKQLSEKNPEWRIVLEETEKTLDELGINVDEVEGERKL